MHVRLTEQGHGILDQRDGVVAFDNASEEFDGDHVVFPNVVCGERVIDAILNDQLDVRHAPRRGGKLVRRRVESDQLCWRLDILGQLLKPNAAVDIQT